MGLFSIFVTYDQGTNTGFKGQSRGPEEASLTSKSYSTKFVKRKN